MPSSRETNTMAEGLRRILNEITSMKTMPDGDLAFLVDLETTVLSYLRAPTQATQAGASVGGGMGGMEGAMGMMPGMSSQGGMGSPVAQYPSAPPGTPAGGGISSPAIPPEELAAFLEAGG